MITVIAPTGNAPLYHKYSGQIAPQGAYIELDCRTGILSASWNPEIGNAVPMAVYHGHVQRYGITQFLSRAALADVLNDPYLIRLAGKVCSGYSERWDGNNMVADFSDDAIDAGIAIDHYCGAVDPDVDIYDIEDYLFQWSELSDYWSDQPLAEAVAAIDAEISALPSNICVYGDAENALIERAKWEFFYDRHLNKNHVRELLKRGIINRDDAREWLRDRK